MKKSPTIKALAFLTVLSACLLAARSATAQVQTTWNGGTADWENPTFWDNGVPNSASADAVIDGGKTGAASVVSTLCLTVGIGALAGFHRWELTRATEGALRRKLASPS